MGGMGPGPGDPLRKLLLKQRQTGRLPVDALRSLSAGIGRGPTATPMAGSGTGARFRPGAIGGGFAGPGFSPFLGASNIMAQGGPGPGVSHAPRFGPSPIVPSAAPGVIGPPPGQGGPGAPSQGGDPFQSPYPADQGIPGQIINPAGRGAGFMSGTAGALDRQTSGLVNPAAGPDNRQATLDALARFLMNQKMSGGGGGGAGGHNYAI